MLKLNLVSNLKSYISAHYNISKTYSNVYTESQTCLTTLISMDNSKETKFETTLPLYTRIMNLFQSYTNYYELQYYTSTC